MSSPDWLEVLYSAAPFWVQCREPDVVERVGHPAHVLLRAVQQVRDIRAPWPCAGISITIAQRSLTIPGHMADRSQSRPSVVTIGRVRCPDYGGKPTLSALRYSPVPCLAVQLAVVPTDYRQAGVLPGVLWLAYRLRARRTLRERCGAQFRGALEAARIGE